ncbi:MAG: cytochrome c/FTR1 family iron permease [Chromatiaceae bacterium]
MVSRTSSPLWLLSVLLIGLLCTLPARAADTGQVLLHLLGYVGVDYPETVSQGQIVNASEYAEQREFAQRISELIGQLPANPARDHLQQQADQLARGINQRTPGVETRTLTEEIALGVTDAYQVTVAPRAAPDVARGQTLYAENCTSCHGAQGYGDGPQAANLDPVPKDFHDPARQRQRSLTSLYNAISLGVDGTAMAGFKALSDDDRWALAFHTGSFLFSDAERAHGKTLWESGVGREWLGDLRGVATSNPDEIQAKYGEEAVAVLAYLRAHPNIVAPPHEEPLVVSEAKLRESINLYRSGDQEAAYAAAVSAYLDGFELAEAGLSAVDAELKREIEGAMLAYRLKIKQGAPVDVVASAEASLAPMLTQARDALNSSELSPAVAFASAVIILLREGVEAILVLAAIIGYLIKTERRDALPYIHLGWTGALVAGVATWVAATYVVDISGASRELTEGLTALFAAAVLFYVGIWLHSKVQAQRWNQFVRSKMQTAMQQRTLFALSALSFVAVYREVFETVLFYQALAVQAGNSGRAMIVAGVLTAALLLGLAAWLILRASRRLPLRQFFGINTALMYGLAIIFAGKGVAALQEAGVIGVSPIAFPRIDLLGVYPNLQALGLQVILLAVTAVMVLMNRRQAAPG